jgi:hypothetical protein
MNYEQKAKELVEKYTPHAKTWDCYNDAPLEEDHAIKCALIAVDQIIEALFEYDNNTEEHLKEDFPKYFSCELQNMDRDLNYWQEVRKAIEALKQ